MQKHSFDKIFFLLFKNNSFDKYMKLHLTVNIKQSHLLSSFDKIFIGITNNFLLQFNFCYLSFTKFIKKNIYSLLYFQFITVDYKYNNIHRFQLLSFVV